MKKPTPEQIEIAKEILFKAGYIQIYWHINDIIGCAENNNIDLTETQAKEIALLLLNRHDCEIGINWDTILIYIKDYLNT